MLLLAPVVIVAGVVGRAFVPPGAAPFWMAKGSTGAGTGLPHVIYPYALGADGCLRSLPPELLGVKFQPKWRMCEPWELEAKRRRLRVGDAAVLPPPGRE